MDHVNGSIVPSRFVICCRCVSRNLWSCPL